MWSRLLTKWPSIIQLAYILYDTENPSKSKIFNKYINIEEDVIISAESLAIHHISHQKIASVKSKDRAKIQDALKEFLEDVKIADVVVGHNVAFDRKMIVSELLRLTKDLNNDIIDMMNDKKFKCTQEITRPICKLQNKKGKEYYKNPKLIEAYDHFFGCIPKLELLHDALIDAIITLRVFCICLNNEPFDINHTNKRITYYITKITPNKCKKSITKRKIKFRRILKKIRKTRKNR